jgi:hypothetical protein
VKRTCHPFSMRARPIAAAKWLLPPLGGPNRSELAPLPNGGERGHPRLGDHRHSLEIEVVEGLSGGQPRLDEMALDARKTALGRAGGSAHYSRKCGFNLARQRRGTTASADTSRGWSDRVGVRVPCRTRLFANEIGTWVQRGADFCQRKIMQ